VLWFSWRAGYPKRTFAPVFLGEGVSRMTNGQEERSKGYCLMAEKQARGSLLFTGDFGRLKSRRGMLTIF
jgi:hypothetical protein